MPILPPLDHPLNVLSTDGRTMVEVRPRFAESVASTFSRRGHLPDADLPHLQRLARLTNLSESEREVLDLAARGLTAKETAVVRRVSYETVKSQRKRILMKLGARSITQAVSIMAGHEQAQEEPLTAKQLVAVHARSASVDQRCGRTSGRSKRLALSAASFHFKREIEHTNELLYLEASWVLDYLQEELEAVPA